MSNKELVAELTGGMGDLISKKDGKYVVDVAGVMSQLEQRGFDSDVYKKHSKLLNAGIAAVATAFGTHDAKAFKAEPAETTRQLVYTLADHTVKVTQTACASVSNPFAKEGEEKTKNVPGYMRVKVTNRGVGMNGIREAVAKHWDSL